MSSRWRRWESVAVGAAAALAHAPSVAGGFLHWDDHRYILQNPFVRSPSWEGLIRLFEEPYYANYHPLHVASYAVDRALFGDSAWGFHLLNVLCFALAAVLAHRFLRRAFPDAGWTFWAALLFAVHPIHVESVAWLSARKDVLSLFLAMAYAVAHVRALDESGGRRAAWYAGEILLFALALLSKVVVAPLPAALLAYELLWRRRRPAAAIAAALPPLALGAAMLAVAYLAQLGSAAVAPYPGGSLATGFLTSAVVVARYLGLLAVPLRLSAIYDVEPHASLADAAVVGALALILTLGALAVVAWRRGDALPLFAFIWFAGTLSPVSGVVPLSHLMADRYLLLPSLAFCAVVAWALARVAARGWAWRRGSVAVGSMLAAALLGASAARSLDWRDDLTLWTDAALKAPRDPVVRVNLGAALADAGRYRDAAAEFAQALRLRPATPEARRNLARAARAMEARGDRAGAEEARRLLASAPAP